MFIRLLLLCAPLYFISASKCVCTTVDCPVEGNNTIIMGNGGANIDYTYVKHNDYEVVVSAFGTITPDSLDNGTGTTSCTQQYSRMLEDDGVENCDAGHILANRLGGYGNIPTNLFPQNSTINRGIYAQFEGDIYECMKSGAKIAHLSWVFYYENTKHTMPNSVNYVAKFDGGECTTLQSLFPN
jgi:hypothetical protein